MDDAQNTLMRDIADPQMKRKAVAFAYAYAIRQMDEVDFAMVNRAIIERWSESGLAWIKAEAWRVVEAGKRASR